MSNQGEKTVTYKRAIEASWLAVIFIIPLFFYPDSYNVFHLNKILMFQFLVSIMLGLFVADWLKNPAQYRNRNWTEILRSPLQLSIVVFALLVIIATVNSLNPTVSFWGRWGRYQGLVTILSEIVFCLIISQHLRTRTQLLRAIYVLLASSFIFSLIGILQAFYPETFYSDLLNVKARESRVLGLSGNPLTLSAFLAMVIPLNMAMIVNIFNQKKHRWKSPLLTSLIILLVVQFWCLYLAQYNITLFGFLESNTIVGFLVSTGMFIAILVLIAHIKTIIKIGSIVAAAAILFAIFSIIPLLVSDESGGKEEKDETDLVISTKIIDMDTMSERIKYWNTATDVIFKSPGKPYVSGAMRIPRAFIGYGPETYVATSQALYPDDLITKATEHTKFADRPHNHYLYLGTTIGLLGLFSFIAVLFISFRLSWQKLRESTHLTNQLILAGITASIAQYAIEKIFNLSVLLPEIILWLSLGLLITVSRLIQHEDTGYSETDELENPSRAIRKYQGYPRSRALLSIWCLLLLTAIGIFATSGPFRADIQFSRAIELKSMGNPETLAAFTKAADIQPNEANYWGAKANYARSIAFLLNDKPQMMLALEISAKSYDKAREAEPYLAFWCYSEADMYAFWAVQTGSEVKLNEALNLYEKADKLFPDNAIILDKWARALIIKNDYLNARLILDEAFDADPDWPETFFLSGLLSATEGNYSEATREVTAAIEMDPSNLEDFEFFCGHIAAVYQIFSPMHQALEASVPSLSDEWIPHALLGITSFISIDTEKSIAQLDIAMNLVPAEDAPALFESILSLAKKSPSYTEKLSGVAPGWEEKLSQTPQGQQLLPDLEIIVKSGAEFATEE